jgi:hypothetical protein
MLLISQSRLSGALGAAPGSERAASSVPGHHDSSGGQRSRRRDSWGSCGSLAGGQYGAPWSTGGRRGALWSWGGQAGPCLGAGPPDAGKARRAGSGPDSSSGSRSGRRLGMDCPWSRFTGRAGSLSDSCCPGGASSGTASSGTALSGAALSGSCVCQTAAQRTRCDVRVTTGRNDLELDLAPDDAALLGPSPASSDEQQCLPDCCPGLDSRVRVGRS